MILWRHVILAIHRHVDQTHSAEILMEYRLAHVCQHLLELLQTVDPNVLLTRNV